MKIDLQKGKERVGNVVGKAANLGLKAVDGAATRVQTFAEKVQSDNLKAQLKKYNPVFPSQYNDTSFNLSNLIVIVDDAVRKDIEACKGAIGWKAQVKGVEVFYLYDEAVATSGIRFIPAAVCDSIYYMDVHDRKSFVRLDSYFDRMRESKLAELQHIAFSLGAKKYSVEMIETSSEKRTINQNGSISKKDSRGDTPVTINTAEESSLSEGNKSHREALAQAEFEGDMKPTQPVLRWFVHDDNINNLINMRCSGENQMNVYQIVIRGSDYASMAASTAAKIDAAVGGLGLSATFSMQSNVIEERSKVMRFRIEF